MIVRAFVPARNRSIFGPYGRQVSYVCDVFGAPLAPLAVSGLDIRGGTMRCVIRRWHSVVAAIVFAAGSTVAVTLGTAGPAAAQVGGQVVNQAHFLCLDAASQNDGSNGDKVQLWTCTGTLNQFWTINGVGSNPTSYTIVNAAHGLCLDAVAQNDGGNGDKVQLWHCNGGANQNWIPGNQNPTAFVNGAHLLCLDAVAQNDGGNGDQVQLWSCRNASNQGWGY